MGTDEKDARGGSRSTIQSRAVRSFYDARNEHRFSSRNRKKRSKLARGGGALSRMLDTQRRKNAWVTKRRATGMQVGLSGPIISFKVRKGNNLWSRTTHV